MGGLLLYMSCMSEANAAKESTLTTKQQCDPENSRREETDIKSETETSSEMEISTKGNRIPEMEKTITLNENSEE